jgi:hypothetical protein
VTPEQQRLQAAEAEARLKLDAGACCEHVEEPNQPGAEDGPVCHCGAPSALECGLCERCATPARGLGARDEADLSE